jgi:hypothetical protein
MRRGYVPIPQSRGSAMAVSRRPAAAPEGRRTRFPRAAAPLASHLWRMAPNLYSEATERRLSRSVLLGSRARP